jgi:hypothetical protein
MDKKISQLTQGTPLDTDIIPYVDLVTGETKKAFKSELKGDTGDDGLDITWRGAYSGATAYAVNDAVSYNGSSYICILSSTGNLPTNGTYWNLMASKGDTGATGATGAQGIQGNTGATGATGANGRSLIWEGPWVTATADYCKIKRLVIAI